MDDDIVTRLRNSFTTKDYPMLKDHCESCAIPKEWGGHWGNCLYDQAADEIERLRLIVHRWNSCEQVSGELCGWDSEKTLCQFCKVTDHE